MDSSRSTSTGTDGAEDDTAASYVNYCEITAGLSVAELILGQAVPDDDRVVVKGRFVTSPTHLHRFSEMLAGACQAYDDRFGAPSGNGSSISSPAARDDDWPDDDLRGNG